MLKIFKFIIIVVLIVAIAAGVGVGIHYLSNKTTPGDSDSDMDGYTIAAISDKGKKLYSGGTYDMPEAMTIVAPEPEPGQYSPEGEIIITASVSNGYINGVFDFTWDFVRDYPWFKMPNTNFDWLDTIQAADYISVTPVSSNQAKVTLIKSFLLPIEIKAQLIGSDAYATCRVDCLATPSFGTATKVYLYDVTGKFGYDSGNTDFKNEPFDFGDTGKILIETAYRHSTGTVTDKFAIRDCTLQLTSDFVETLKSYLKFDIAVKDFNVQASAASSLYKDLGDDGSYKIEGYELEIGTLKFSMFIEGFDSLSEQQKKAIYYAWYAAYKTAEQSPNIEIQINHLQRIYLDTVLNEFDEVVNKAIRLRIGAITGAQLGKDAQPDAELNGK